MANDTQQKDLKLSDKYKLKGAQSVTIAELEAASAKKSRKTKFKIPPYLTYILGTPFIILACCGVIFIPYMLFLIFTSPQAPAVKEDGHDMFYTGHNEKSASDQSRSN